jgi:hypothetical protein
MTNKTDDPQIEDKTDDSSTEGSTTTLDSTLRPTKTYRRCEEFCSAREAKRLRAITFYLKADANGVIRHRAILEVLRTLRQNFDDRFPQWERASVGLKGFYGMKALTELGFSPHVFTINLGQERAQRAGRHYEGAARHLYREIHAKLKRTFADPPPFLFFWEMAHGVDAETGATILKPHIHGCIGVRDEADAAVLRQVFHTVSHGYTCRQRAVHIEPLRSELYWGLYCAKDVWRTSKLVAGAPCAFSQVLTRHGRELYELDVLSLKAFGCDDPIAPSPALPDDDADCRPSAPATMEHTAPQ